MIDWSTPPHQLRDEELLREYRERSAEMTERRRVAPAAEIEQRGLEI